MRYGRHSEENSRAVEPIDQKSYLAAVLLSDQNRIFQMSKRLWLQYRGENTKTLRISAQDDSTSDVSLRWRSTRTIWWFATGLVKPATLREMRNLADRKCLEGLLAEYFIGLNLSA